MITITRADGSIVRTLPVRWVPTGRLVVQQLQLDLLPGLYQFSVTATDLAGNEQARMGTAKLAVKWEQRRGGREPGSRSAHAAGVPGEPHAGAGAHEAGVHRWPALGEEDGELVPPRLARPEGAELESRHRMQ